MPKRQYLACLIVIAFVLPLLSMAIPMQAQNRVVCPDAPASRLVVGQEATVLPAAGINLRDRPGLNTNRIDIIGQGVRVRVLEGPLCAAGFAWWRIDANGARGWTAEGLTEGYWLEPYLKQDIEIDGVLLQVPLELAENVLVQRLPAIQLDPAEDVMRLNRPQVQRFILQDYPIAPIVATDTARVDLYAAERFQQLNPRANAAINQLTALLDTQTALDAGDVTPFNTDPNPLLPELFSVQREYLNFQNGQGVRAVVAYTLVRNLQDARPLPPSEQTTRLAYVFQGLSADGQTFVLAQMPVTSERLPEQAFISPGAAQYDERTNAQIRDVRAFLDGGAPDAFTPNLRVLDDMMRSLLTAAPPEEAESARAVRYFDSVFFAYPPTLADDVQSRGIAPDAAENTVQHVRFDFEGYAVDTYQYRPAIRVYQVADFADDRIRTAQLERLRTLLDGQIDAGGSIPILHITDSAQFFRTRAEALDFANGRGVRFLTAYPDDMTRISNLNLFYSFQGISDDGQFYISAVLPVHTPDLAEIPAPEAFPSYVEYIAAVVRTLENSTQFTPDLAQLDELIRTLRLGSG